MACTKGFIDYVLDQVAAAGDVRARAMFGEYALYCDNKVVALICDDRVFLKPTPAGRALYPDAEDAPAYPGAKPHMAVSEDVLDDGERMASLIVATAAALPAPKPKRSRKVKKPSPPDLR